jgi:hypothetical protein
MNPQVSIIIVNYNTRALTEACLRSIEAQVRGVSHEVVLVDNASSDGSAEMVRERFPAVRLIENPCNLGFGVANNIGAGVARGEHLMLLNSDAELLSDSASALLEFLRAHPLAAAVGPRVLLPDGRRQPMITGDLPGLRAVRNDALFLSRLAPGFFPGIHHDEPGESVAEVGWISGVCMMIRRDAWEQVGGFDPSYFMYCEDIDLCRRFRQRGWTIVHLDDAAIRHHNGGSSKSAQQKLRSKLMQQRHFLSLLGNSLDARELKAAKFFLGVGLLLRMAVGGGQAVVGRGDGRFLFESSAWRLAELTGFAS